MEIFSQEQVVLITLLFLWSGFVRSGIGFGGAALTLPFLLLISDEPLYWLPIIGTHLLFFTAITLYGQLKRVDWSFIFSSLKVIIVPKIIGVFGLLHLPTSVVSIFIYAMTILYSVSYIMNFQLKQYGKKADFFLLATGGYISGTMLIGAPFIVAVATRTVVIDKLKHTLFALWIVLVSIKMSGFYIFDVPLQFKSALYLLPAAAVGHWLGVKAHSWLLSKSDQVYKPIVGVMMLSISIYGLLQY